MNDHDWLLQEWEELIWRASLGESSNSLGRDILHRYAEPQRAYHTGAHLRQLLTLLIELKAPVAIQLAAWFHDAVYEPGRSDNESRSADLAQDSLRACGYPDSGIKTVCEAIRATSSHQSTNAQVALLLDADLSILGAAPDDYGRYCEGIRREFGAVSLATFTAGRAAFLNILLSLPAIFKTADCRRRFEEAARRNLQAELQQLVS